MSHPVLKLIILFFSLLLLFGCQEVRQPLPARTGTDTTIVPSQTPAWMKVFKNPIPLNRGSSFYSLDDPFDAFAARLYLIDHATASIDVQYYIYKNDLTAAEFTYRLLQAAERGVKVRLLVDDLTTSGRDRDIAYLAAHPNIDIKLFNPNHFRTLFRNMAMLLDVNTLGKRMHNKTFTVDGYASILGGRNIGDEYFAANNDMQFVDYDILAVGKIVPKVYRSFDIYWNSPLAVSYEKLIKKHIEPEIYKKTIAHLTQLHRVFEKSRLASGVAHSTFMQDTRRGSIPLYGAQNAALYFDLPEKVVSDQNDDTTHLSKGLKGAIAQVHHELIVISPYFIPSPEMMKSFQKLRERNVTVIVVTNSLASTDVPLVYSGYRKYIKPLLEMGVELYELKPSAHRTGNQKKKKKSSDRFSLHSKILLVDTSRMLVGSANIDPRSDKLNTEVLMLIQGSPLIPHLKKGIKAVLNGHYFYRLTLQTSSRHSKRKSVVWTAREAGKEKHYRSIPKAGTGRRIGTDLFSLLPIEGYL